VFVVPEIHDASAAADRTAASDIRDSHGRQRSLLTLHLRAQITVGVSQSIHFDSVSIQSFTPLDMFPGIAIKHKCGSSAGTQGQLPDHLIYSPTKLTFSSCMHQQRIRSLSNHLVPNDPPLSDHLHQTAPSVYKHRTILLVRISNNLQSPALKDVPR
jgi:hypothetical protein